ncbi:MAG: oxygen-independent coproporphyrinogen III oxidase [Hyphomicrobiales bacterium]|nr:oxygen-independent coproporphyrinogen III oxidase [Hyphomicrobiales bacterium]
MDKNLSAYATRTVPRYTSYPTAPHFGIEVDADTYCGWLDALDPALNVSLYLHIPYCRSICRYCGCHTKAAVRDDPVYDYADMLAAEIDLVAERLGARRRVSHIHWGGGTPTLLPAEPLAMLADKLATRFEFAEGGEHAMELDPRTVDAALAGRLKAAGVNRASLGVQDFTPAVQEAIGRIQPFETVVESVEYLKAVGITAINFDLMYGLPLQTADDVARTAEMAASLEPARIAIFGYAHVPWFKVHQRLIKTEDLPGAMERIEQAERARAVLEGLGYVSIGFDHFARADDPMAVALSEGGLKRNFQGYTTDTARALIGFGASSIGQLPQGYIQNNPDIGHYKRTVAEGKLPIVRGKALSADDRLRAEIIETLMTTLHVDIAEVAARHDADVATFAPAFAALEDLVRDELVVLDGSTIDVTATGRPFVRLAAAAFDAYLDAEKARHSVAV